MDNFVNIKFIYRKLCLMFKYGIDKLTIEKVMQLANGQLKGELCAEAREKVNICRNKVETMANSDKAVYGVNTGFGPMCDTQDDDPG